MDKLPLVVAHYTLNTGYEKEIKCLEASLDRWELDRDITPIRSLGSWRANSNFCATHIKEMMIKHPDRDILRVDADAVFQRYPSLFLNDDFQADIAAVIHSFRWRQNELLGGTLFFRNNDRVLALVTHWERLCRTTHPNDRNPDLLQGILNANQFPVTFGVLPPTYCKIFDLMPEVENPVIEHFQASRRFKRAINIQGAKARQHRQGFDERGM